MGPAGLRWEAVRSLGASGSGRVGSSPVCSGRVLSGLVGWGRVSSGLVGSGSPFLVLQASFKACPGLKITHAIFTGQGFATERPVLSFGQHAGWAGREGRRLAKRLGGKTEAPTRPGLTQTGASPGSVFPGRKAKGCARPAPPTRPEVNRPALAALANRSGDRPDRPTQPDPPPACSADDPTDR
jgi:hypothetical protein